MKTKSFPIRSSRTSLDPSPSLPERFGSGVSNTHYEIVPDAFDERDVPHKKRHCLGTSETGLSLDACIVCEVSDKGVSRCCGVDCLVSFHEECLDAEFGGGSEDLENQFCPYCWFKIVASKSKALRDKAIEAEKTVFEYLDKEMKSKDQVKESVLKCQEDKNLCDDEDGDQEHSVESTDIVSDQEHLVEEDSDKSNTPLIEETDQREEDKSGDMEEDKEERVATENFQDTEDDETGKEHDQVQQNENRRRRRRRLILNDTDSEISSTEEGNGEEDVTEQITSSTNVAKSKTVVREISFFNKDQRRRLLWTSEEEEMLKVGVERFAAEANKNMPWRKILEMGEKVFHETRTPADLKDKWRNMIRLGQIKD